jgi:hypothetical protein
VIDRLKTNLREMTTLGRVQLGLSLAAFVAALVSSIYLAASVLVQQEACYGVKAGKNPCAALGPQVLLNLVLVLAIVLAMYAGAVLLSLGQQRAADPFARMTAMMFLILLALLIMGMTLSASSGPGFYLLPALALLIAAVLVGVAAYVLSGRSAAAPR